MNEALFRFINDTVKCPFLDWLMPAFSDKDFVVIPGIVALLLVLYFGGRRARTCVAALVLSVLLADTGSEKALKNIVRAKRPYARLSGVHLHRGGQWMDYNPAWYAYDSRKSNGFPSSHAANVAAAAAALFVLRRRTLWVTAPVAALVGLSRVYTGNHFPLDVVGGYAWGLAAAFTGVKTAFWAVRRMWGPDEAKPDAPQPVSRERRILYWVLGAWTLMNFGFLHLNLLDLAGDEAQYWDWSRRLDLGYYSKPPMIAYVIHVLKGAGGNSEWAIRSGAVLFSSGALALIYALARRIAQSDRAALLAVIATLAMPAAWAGSVIMTIDPLLVFFWVWAMYAFHRAVAGDRGMWALTGLALGLGMLSKYTMAILYVSFALYLVLVDRKCLRTKGPYIALAISLLCMSGVLYWNWAHGWVSFLHTASIGASATNSPGKALRHFGEFFGSQIGVVSPILFGFYAWALWKCLRRFKKNRDAAYLAICFGVLFGLYALVSFFRKPEPNWPVAAYPAAAIALGWVWSQTDRAVVARRTLAAGLVLGCLVGVAARSTGVLYVLGSNPGPGESSHRLHIAGLSIDPDKDPTNKMRGGRELGVALKKYVEDKRTGPFLFSNSYQVTAWAAFYTPGRPQAFCLPFLRRQNQYDIWGGWDRLAGRDGIFVTGGDQAKAERFIEGMIQAKLFERGEYQETVEVRRGHTRIKTFTISRLYNYSGADLKPLALY